MIGSPTDELVDALTELRVLFPDWRLGQLIANLVTAAGGDGCQCDMGHGGRENPCGCSPGRSQPHIRFGNQRRIIKDRVCAQFLTQWASRRPKGLRTKG